MGTRERNASGQLTAAPCPCARARGGPGVLPQRTPSALHGTADYTRLHSRHPRRPLVTAALPSAPGTWDCSFPTPHVKEVPRRVSFRAWLVSRSTAAPGSSMVLRTAGFPPLCGRRGSVHAVFPARPPPDARGVRARGAVSDASSILRWLFWSSPPGKLQNQLVESTKHHAGLWTGTELNLWLELRTDIFKTVSLVVFSFLDPQRMTITQSGLRNSLCDE